MMAKKKIKFNINKNVMKLVQGLIIVGVSGLAAEYGDSVWFGLLGPLLFQLQNAAKHGALGDWLAQFMNK